MSFIVNEENHDEFKMWQGLQGPYYTPYVSENGIISWTNNGGLPNPSDVNIKGEPGAGLEISGTADTVGDLPETAEEYSIYLVGTSEPYYGYIYADGEWTNIGEIGKGETGEGVPTGGTTGQVLKKSSNADYDTEWGAALDPATASPLMDGTAAVGVSDKYAREDHVHPVYDQIVRPNLLDNWYFVGGGSQQGGGQFPINQRGQTSYSNNWEYTVDRWKKTGGSSALTVSSSGLSSTGAVLIQIVNNVGDLLGKKLTISGLINGSLDSAVVNVPNSIPSSWTRLARISFGNSFISVDIDQGSSLQVLLELYSSDVCTAAKLELGTTQTLAHQENGVWVLNEIPNFADELAKCQRYYLANVGAVSTAYCNEDKAYVKIPTPTTMRANPSASLASTGVVVAPNAQYGVASVSYAEVYNDGVMVVLNTDRSSALGLEMAVYAGGIIYLSADL